VFNPLFDLQKRSASIEECQWVLFFPHGVIKWHNISSYTIPHQIQFCQTAPLVPSVTWQQNAMEYWQEDSVSTDIPPISASDVVGQYNKIGGNTFGAALK